MKVKVTSEFETARGIISAGQIIEVPETLLSKLAGKVELVTESHARPEISPPPGVNHPDWWPEPKAWLTESGELRTAGVFDDLAGEIIRLTTGNLPLQAILLRRHVGDYSGPAWGALVEHWQERAAIMQFDSKMDKATAEHEAAKLYRAEAFLDELRVT